MSIQTGYLDSNGHPRLTIRVSGTHPTACADIEAMIDTGFTGFLMLPIAIALPLGLVLYGTGNYTLADGSQVTNFLAQGTVTVLAPTIAPVAILPGAPPVPVSDLTPESIAGTIVLGGDGPLLGMEFIRNLDKMLMVGKTVILIDNAVLTALQQQAVQQQTAAAAPPTNQP
jgi:predicted aspartyl protease